MSWRQAAALSINSAPTTKAFTTEDTEEEELLYKNRFFLRVPRVLCGGESELESQVPNPESQVASGMMSA
jgi:hypothetical protein